MNLCVIPARGGSKRIPHKNIKDFCGHPIISYSISTAIASGCFDKIIVSTDDHTIAETAQACGAEVPFIRPREIADDHSGTGAVTAHAARWAQEQQLNPEFICCLYATAPLLTPPFLVEALAMLKARPDYDYCFSAAAFAAPIQRALKRDADGGVAMFHPENYFLRSQDLEPAYHDAGQFYWGRLAACLKDEPIFLQKSLIYVLPRDRVEDIDTPEDWIRAEQMYRILNQPSG